MKLLFAIVVSGGCSFYLRFLWAMHQELRQYRSTRVVSPHEVERGEQTEEELSEEWRGVLAAPFSFGRGEQLKPDRRIHA